LTASVAPARSARKTARTAIGCRPEPIANDPWGRLDVRIDAVPQSTL
jgi:hypothetical protein